MLGYNSIIQKRSIFDCRYMHNIISLPERLYDPTRTYISNSNILLNLLRKILRLTFIPSYKDTVRFHFKVSFEMFCQLYALSLMFPSGVRFLPTLSVKLILRISLKNILMTRHLCFLTQRAV